ncbi:hypothetical protein AVEN_236095-1 [Araneus ventricosus]|uniref:Uncharacterized protein n=1 Tax=Araneus ventricosus TaxID=182803 RepID=A0A4Y2HK18_ARAVE|nr:hypothetical protein AVEN_236095-1 [Araneus ventricosus]
MCKFKERYGMVLRTVITDSRASASRLVGRGFETNSAKDPPCTRVWCTLNRSESSVLPLKWSGSFESGVPAQVSSDYVSKLSGLLENYSVIISKWEFTN